VPHPTRLWLDGFFELYFNFHSDKNFEIVIPSEGGPRAFGAPAARFSLTG